ncbi:hypothetical protein B4U79_18826 [Dinothrombium tinctorium]|uniref:TIL domain-containing protein n=1 Tax=Dinothrombium tinctorium TaxID=1965070 RepID=A0A3S4Q4D4_9ACAR|nr:hypothetical protein B4U79_18888 [Dinothrombium tinctorium]RWR98640.1 hypothetical protein B4U79_18887 [Dinothrombium tinctorium]RWR99163.1 hypothetical protein B4U79_18826 [Dinothrombium tinctorium]
MNLYLLECGENEIYSNSVDTCNACPYIIDPSLACPRSVYEGCGCKSGFTRKTDINSKCIPKSDC